MGRERAEERGLLPPRVLTPDGGLRPVHVDPQARGRETAPGGWAYPGPGDEGHTVQIPATVLDEFERPDVFVLLHHLEHAADQLRRGTNHAVRLARGLRVPHCHHGVVESILQHGVPSAVLPEAELVGNLAEALPAEVEPIPADDAALASAAQAAPLPTKVLRAVQVTTSTLKRSFMNCIPSSPETRCRRGIRRDLLDRRATRHPGR